MSVFVFATVIPKPEHANDLEAELRRMVAATRAEPGNRRYDLFRAADGTPGLHLFEIYEDAQALEAHRASAHYRAYREKVAAYLAQPPDVKVLSALDVVHG
jgi:quinol monooxygenase YgiN